VAARRACAAAFRTSPFVRWRADWLAGLAGLEPLQNRARLGLALLVRRKERQRIVRRARARSGLSARHDSSEGSGTQPDSCTAARSLVVRSDKIVLGRLLNRDVGRFGSRAEFYRHSRRRARIGPRISSRTLDSLFRRVSHTLLLRRVRRRSRGSGSRNSEL
jgi:hypothetical protein